MRNRIPTNAYMLAFVVLFTAWVSSCAYLGLEPAQSFDERLAYAVTQNAAVRNAAATSLEAGAITLDEARQVLKITDEARSVLDAARLASGVGDLQTAEAKLVLASRILTELRTYLTTTVEKT